MTTSVAQIACDESQFVVVGGPDHRALPPKQAHLGLSLRRFWLFVHRNAEIWLRSGRIVARRKLLLYFAVRNLGAIGAAGTFACV